jgi:predicted murein hydrolase (TIGR00659 family)
MKPDLDLLWIYLRTTPLLGLAVTLIAYQVAIAISGRLKGITLANPMLIAIGLIVALLLATGTPYPVYFQGAQYVQFLLGPATVALAVPMYANLSQIRRSARALLPALLAGSAVAAASAMGIAHLLGATRTVVLSLAPKSVTTPIAMGITEQIGGEPSLTAVFVLMTGIMAILLQGPVMKLLRITSWSARGLSAGTAGHGLATARVLLQSETAGAFGGVAIGLNGLVTSLMVPLLVRLFDRF